MRVSYMLSLRSHGISKAARQHPSIGMLRSSTGECKMRDNRQAYGFYPGAKALALMKSRMRRIVIALVVAQLAGAGAIVTISGVHASHPEMPLLSLH